MPSIQHVLLHWEPTVTFSDVERVSQHALEPVQGKLLVCVVTGTLCGSRCRNKAAVHNYNRLIEEFVF